ncbi:MAG: FAD-dependent oxidoreductase [Thermoleophilia bacterium]|nr:FAD-dependent oxidoreductase [Thermoleophilia bacterium]
MTKRILILGNSAAALAALRAYRACGGEGQVTLVSREACPAYSPVLTTYYLRGRIPEEGLFVCDPTFYENSGVETLFGHSVVELDTVNRSVGLDDGRRIAYDLLLIATGASPRRLEGLAPGVAEGICYLRTIEDARRIRRRAEQAAHVVVVGGGLVSLQVATALARPGRPVTGVVSSQQLLSQNIDPPAAGMVQRHIEQQERISFLFGASLEGIEKDGESCLLSLDSGQELLADLVVVGKGVAPNLDFVDRAEIEVGRGILVDEHLRTTAEGVYAAGDVTEGRNRVSGLAEPVPNWVNACEQGRIAGINLAGRKVTFEGSFPENITTVFGLPVASIGLARVPEDDPELRAVVHADDGRTLYRKLVLRGDRLVGALLVGDIEDAGVLRSVIAGGGRLDLSEEEVLRGELCQAARLRSCRFGSPV